MHCATHGIYFGDKAYTSERCTNLRALHGTFVKECINAGVQNTEYPLNTKDSGYEALRVCIRKLGNTEMLNGIKREGREQRQKFLSTGYGNAITLIPVSPYDQVQADGHVLDILYTVETTDVDGIPIREVATRLWLFAIIDVATRCIIGYSVSPHMNYNRFDLLEAVKNSILPHEHRIFKLNSLSYPKDGGFPSEAIPECRYALFNTIMLDNAKAHLTSEVVDKLTDDLGCVVNFGSVATPESRGIVERFFGTLERSGFHRLPSSQLNFPSIDFSQNIIIKKTLDEGMKLSILTAILSDLFSYTASILAELMEEKKCLTGGEIINIYSSFFCLPVSQYIAVCRNDTVELWACDPKVDGLIKNICHSYEYHTKNGRLEESPHLEPV